MKIFVTYILNWIWHDLSVTVDIMSLQFGHDVLQHFLPTMDRFSQKEKQVLLRHNCERHKSSISYSRQRRGRCWQTSIFFVFFEIWLCDVLERPTVQENRCCWYFVVQAPMDKSSVTKYKMKTIVCCVITAIIQSVLPTLDTVTSICASNFLIPFWLYMFIQDLKVYLQIHLIFDI